VIALWGSNLRRVGGNLWYIERGEVSTLLFVGCFPRRICAYMVGFPRGVVVRKLNKVVEVWVWLG
jgi:hypothetical protein